MTDSWECALCKKTTKAMIDKIADRACEPLVAEFRKLCEENIGKIPGAPSGACADMAAEVID